VGFSHGVIAPAGSRLLYVAGQTATDRSGTIVHGDFAAQFAAALERVLAVVQGAGGSPADIARMTIYVTDLETYRSSRPALGEIWARLMGRHYPAMALLEVNGLVDRGALVEIAADAVLPPATPDANARHTR
jgi:enamine deaminase RidA (YjgF/YER057c/UK114 family)